MATRKKLSPEVLKRIELRNEAREKFREFMEWAQVHQPPRWVYRGHSQKWTLKPTIGRAKHYKPEIELQIFQEFRRLAYPHVKEHGRLTTWEWLAIAQHHGLPTRLLDWTTNPLIAFYFACGSSAREKRDGEVIAVEAKREGFYRPEDPKEADPFQILKTGFIYPSAVATRISAQRGLFSVHPFPKKAWILRNKTDRFVIPAKLKKDLQRYLFSVGVDSALVMADLDGLAKSLNWRFLSKVPFE